MIRLLVCLCALFSAAVLPPGARASEASLDPVAVALETDRLADASFLEMLAREHRMIEIATRVRRSAVELCEGRLAPILGLQVTNVFAQPRAYINPAIRRFGASDDERVVWVVPGSAAERAGLESGDSIRTVDGFQIRTEADLNNRRAASGATSLRFAIERAGSPRTIDVPYEPGCYVQPVMKVSTTNNAGVAWRSFVIYSELIRAATSDDEIAAVIGHELAHKILGHSESAPNAEAEADYFGLYLSARAGYSPEKGAEFWRRRSRTQPWSVIDSPTHPSATQRFLAAQRATKEIAAKRAAGQPLRPEPAQ